jgi:hypothetical protein
VHFQDQIKADCDALHGTADAEYVQLKYSGQWLVPKGNGNPSAMNIQPYKKAALQAGVCWNCGKEGHRLSECPEERNPQRIEVNKKAFNEYKSKKSDSTSSGQKGMGNEAKGGKAKWK